MNFVGGIYPIKIIGIKTKGLHLNSPFLPLYKRKSAIIYFNIPLRLSALKSPLTEEVIISL